jgi:hypothetical protein
MPRLPPWLGFALALTPVAVACGSSATGVSACKSIEEARCSRLPSCPNIQISPPLWFTSGTAAEACIRYYDTACFHGLEIGTDPGSTNVDACVSAIQHHGCAVVASPQVDPSCAWLIPPADVDAGQDSGADAASDADANEGQ